MGCNCGMTESIIAMVVLVVTLWPDLIGIGASKWVIVIAAVLLLLHANMCKGCKVDKGASKKKKRK